ncbi:amidohydrolase family protein [Pseudolabrys taiwanensis]|uniref:amidohydrolase family protein n=1 Tax=Pseudolabrys taiwanensis TaxID=331696 RepID=UPI001FE20914|nr:amidohydrolase family protein [Pseudolabrys taiwanensis]
MEGLSWPSRRGFLKGAAALSATATFVAEAVPPAHADGSINQSLQQGLGGERATEAPGQPVVFIARKVITMERGPLDATAIAVAGKRIVAVGTLDRVKAALGARAYTTDESFKDKVVLPGLIDQHLHPILGALTLAVPVIAPEDWVLPKVVHKAALTPDAYWARLKEAETALTNPSEWLITWGYHALWHGPLDRTALDKLSATRPIAVWHRSCHEFYLNTAALAALGIGEAMTVGKGQYSEQANWREGHFWEGGLNLIMAPMLKVLASPARLAFGLKQMVAYLHGNGVTAYMEPGALYTPDIWKLYEQILGAPETPMYATFIADGRGIVDRVGLDRALDATEAQIAVAPEGPGKKLMFFPGQVKLFADGAIISQLMQMKDGYLDGHKGEWILQPDELEKRARLYWNAGYQIHTHVNGDLGLEVLLTILEKLNAEHPRSDHRCVIVHFANATEDQIARIKKLGAIVSANPYYTVGFADKYSAVGLGPERADMMVRSQSVLDRGIPLSYHSDLPMAPSAPLYLAWCGINRITPSGRVAGPAQRVSVDAALRAITIEAAYSWRKEDQIGSIAPGKIANFTVLEEDPYIVAPEKLKDIPVTATVFEGKVYPVARG